jgi:hypothetical protein
MQFCDTADCKSALRSNRAGPEAGAPMAFCRDLRRGCSHHFHISKRDEHLRNNRGEKISGAFGDPVSLG